MLGSLTDFTIALMCLCIVYFVLISLFCFAILTFSHLVQVGFGTLLTVLTGVTATSPMT